MLATDEAQLRRRQCQEQACYGSPVSSPSGCLACLAADQTSYSSGSEPTGSTWSMRRCRASAWAPTTAAGGAAQGGTGSKGWSGEWGQASSMDSRGTALRRLSRRSPPLLAACRQHIRHVALCTSMHQQLAEARQRLTLVTCPGSQIVGQVLQNVLREARRIILQSNVNITL